MQSNHPIKITIQAAVGGGKSTIAAIITKALQDAGFQNVSYKDEDGDLETGLLDPHWYQQEVERIAKIKDTPVQIKVSTLTYSKVLPITPT